MSSHSKLLVIGLILEISIGVVGAQSRRAGAYVTTTTARTMPFIAEVVGSDVNVRSGAGTAFYYTGRISAPAKVTVVGERTGWYEIIPPAGSFSWISKDFVDPDPANPGIGMVNDTGVNVWAGSDYRDPMRSTSPQVKLNKGDIVKLMDPDSRKGSYYKIVPSPGAHLWISKIYLQYVESISRPKYDFMIKPEPKVEPKIEPNVIIEPIVTSDTDPKVDKPKVEEPKVTTTEIGVSPDPVTTVAGDGSVEEQRVKECRTLAEQIGEELKKPLAAQNYDEYKRAVTVILNDAGAGKAVRYAEYQLAQIKRFELARLADEDVKKQDSALDKLRREIKEKYAARIAEVPDPGKYIIKGKIQPSLVYTGQSGQKRYKILGDDGKVVCYAVPGAGASGANADIFIGRLVGLKGTIDRDTASVGLVTFTAIEELAAVPQDTDEPGM